MHIFGLLVLLSVHLIAAPAPPTPFGPLAPEAAGIFATNMTKAFEAICKWNYREASLVDLVLAGVDGLYGAARVSVPESVLDRGRELASHRELATKCDGPSMTAIREFFLTTRMSLRDRPELRNSNDSVRALETMLKKYDRFSYVIRNLDGRFTSSGLSFSSEPGAYGWITGVAPGSAAQKAGFQPGDRVTHIDSVPMAGLPTGVEFWSYFDSGHDETGTVTVECARGNSRVKLALKKGHSPPELFSGVGRKADDTWNFWIDSKNGIALVRIHGFTDDVEKRFRALLEELAKGGMKGLILDLRGPAIAIFNYGIFTGFRAVEMGSQLFFSKGVVASVRAMLENTTDKITKREFTGSALAPFVDLPLVVLVDSMTGGAKELLASVLGSTKRATIVGQRTMGDGSLVYDTHLALETKLKAAITFGEILNARDEPIWRSPTAKSSDPWGVRPDTEGEIPQTLDLTRQIDRELELMVLRPLGSSEAYSLDDPLKDTAKQRGIQIMKKLLLAVK